MAATLNIFPTKKGAAVFAAYTVLCVNQGILVTLSQDKDGKYSYNTTTVVLLTEALKMVVSMFLYLKDSSFSNMLAEIKANWKVGVLYIVPAFLYCLYNNLQFVNLSSYDPTTYYVFLQFRVVVTGVVYELLFSRKLSRIQWLSLFVLTTGCIVKELGHKSKLDGNTTSSPGWSLFGVKPNMALLLMVVQTLCSCIAAVYNEYLLKGKFQPQKNSSGTTPLMIQNIFMYGNSVLCNMLFLALKGDFLHAVQPDSIRSILQLKVLVIMINSCTNGIVTSLFLKELNAILKTFANALEIIMTAFVTYLLFGTPLDVYAVIAIGLVLTALIAYNANPIQNQPVVETKKDENHV